MPCRRKHRRVFSPALMLAGVLMSSVADHAAAQRLDRLGSLPTLGVSAAGGSRARTWTVAARKPPSTFPQRFYTSAIVAWIALGSYWLLDSKDEWGWTVATYSLGSALGVFLVTRGREGMRPLPTLAGTAVGALPGVIVALAENNPEGPGADLAWGYFFLVSAPLGASLGHGLGR